MENSVLSRYICFNYTIRARKIITGCIYGPSGLTINHTCVGIPFVNLLLYILTLTRSSRSGRGHSDISGPWISMLTSTLFLFILKISGFLLSKLCDYLQKWLILTSSDWEFVSWNSFSFFLAKSIRSLHPHSPTNWSLIGCIHPWGKSVTVARQCPQSKGTVRERQLWATGSHHGGRVQWTSLWARLEVLTSLESQLCSTIIA